MMGTHANNMMAQAPAQNQFLPQNQFPSSSGALNVNSVGMGQPAAQASVSQVLFMLGLWATYSDVAPASHWPQHVLVHRN